MVKLKSSKVFPRSPRIGRIGRKARQGTGHSPPAQQSLEPAKQWLSEAERLLNSVVTFAYRAAGSWVHGWLALFARSPVDYLLEKEAQSKLLSWASVLVASSALAGVLSPVIAAGLPEWGKAVSGLASTQNYLERSIPILALGLALCFVAWLGCVLARKVSSVAGTRLLASTYYSLTALTVILSFAMDGLIATSIEAGVLPQNAEKALSLGWLSAGMTICFSGLGIATAWAVGRATIRAIKSAGKPIGKVAWLFILPVAFATPALPFVLGFAAFSSTFLSPALTDYLNPKAFRDPLSEVSVSPYPVSCDASTASKETRTLDCLLVAATTGEGYAFVNVRQAKLFVSDEPLGAWQQERYRFRLENQVNDSTADRPIVYSELPLFALGEIAPLNPSLKAAENIVVELGKPLVWVLRFRLAKACSHGDLMRVMQKADLSPHLYVVVSALRPTYGTHSRKTSPSNKFEAVGPWVLPTAAFYSACTNLSR